MDHEFGRNLFPNLTPFPVRKSQSSRLQDGMYAYSVRRYCIRMLLPLICTQDKVRDG